MSSPKLRITQDDIKQTCMLFSAFLLFTLLPLIDCVAAHCFLGNSRGQHHPILLPKVSWNQSCSSQTGVLEVFEPERGKELYVPEDKEGSEGQTLGEAVWCRSPILASSFASWARGAFVANRT